MKLLKCLSAPPLVTTSYFSLRVHVCIDIYLLIFNLFNHHYIEKKIYRCACTIFFEPLIEYNFVHNNIPIHYYTKLSRLLYVYLFCLYVIIIVTCHATRGPNLEINSILL